MAYPNVFRVAEAPETTHVLSQWGRRESWRVAMVSSRYPDYLLVLKPFLCYPLGLYKGSGRCPQYLLGLRVCAEPPVPTDSNEWLTLKK